MRLPTPSSCLLDGVEGDLYLRHSVLFPGQPGSPLCLVCYCDASCSYRAVLLPTAGLRAQRLWFNVSCCANKLGNRSSSVRALCSN